MDQQQQQQHQPQPQPGGVPGPTGRRLHIAHRRSPSELTPLMSMFANPGSKSMFSPLPAPSPSLALLPHIVPHTAAV